MGHVMQSQGALSKAASRGGLQFYISRLKWDETGEKVCFDAGRRFGGHREVASSTWQVLVARCTVILGFGNVVFRTDIVMPPLVVAGVGADQLHYALTKHPNYSLVWALLASLKSQAQEKVQLYCSDCASGNHRLYAQWLHKVSHDAADDTLMEWQRCHAHQNHIIEAAVLLGVSDAMLSRLYSLTIFWKLSGNWLRLQQSAQRWVKANLIVTQAPRPPEVDAFRDEVRDYIGAHFKQFERARNEGGEANSDDIGYLDLASAGRKPCSKAAMLLEERLDNFFTFFNGDLADECPTHVCGGGTCCQSLHDSERKAQRYLVEMCLSSCPSTPAANKWTKLGPVVDALCTGDCVCALVLGRTGGRARSSGSAGFQSRPEPESSNMSWALPPLGCDRSCLGTLNLAPRTMLQIMCCAGTSSIACGLALWCLVSAPAPQWRR